MLWLRFSRGVGRSCPLLMDDSRHLDDLFSLVFASCELSEELCARPVVQCGNGSSSDIEQVASAPTTNVTFIIQPIFNIQYSIFRCMLVCICRSGQEDDHGDSEDPHASNGSTLGEAFSPLESPVESQGRRGNGDEGGSFARQTGMNRTLSNGSQHGGQVPHL